jgi:galactose mutarotase-like enzyme
MTDMELMGWHTYFNLQANAEKEAYEKAKRRR